MIIATKQVILRRLAALGVASLLACVLTACGMKEESAPAPSKAITPTPVFQPAKPEEKDPFEKYSEKAKPAAQPNGGNKTAKRGPASANGDPPTESAAGYMVKLGADPVIKVPGPSGELRVWIGLPAHEPEYSDLKTKIDKLPATGKTARVTAFAPGLKVDPVTSLCMKTHPWGSEVRFTLTPIGIKSGTFKVGADVALFDSSDCSGTPIPKATTTLQVEVSVDGVKLTLKYLTDLWEVFWDKLLEFWGEALAVFFAALLFLFRKKLKKWLGYTE